MERRSNTPLLVGLLGGVLLADIVTKWLAVQYLVPARVPREVFGEYVRLTLVYNKGAAFGIHVGPFSRYVFLVLTVVALVILWKLFRTTEPGDRIRTAALALVSAGAIGNLIDRVRHAHGVVDFLDIGVGDLRWPTFNVADIAVCTGAFMLAWVLWDEEEQPAAQKAESKPLGGTGSRPLSRRG